MGKIKKILENELVGGTQGTDVYPVTSTKAVYDENNVRLDTILKPATEETAGLMSPEDKKNIDDKLSKSEGGEVNKHVVITNKDSNYSTTINPDGSIYVWNKSFRDNILTIKPSSYGPTIGIEVLGRPLILNNVSSINNTGNMSFDFQVRNDNIYAKKFIKRYATDTDVLLGDGSTTSKLVSYISASPQFDAYIVNILNIDGAHDSFTIPGATEELAGLMTAADKAKLDNIPNIYAEKYEALKNIEISQATGDSFDEGVTLLMHYAEPGVAGRMAVIDNATTTKDGCMSREDKNKLDNIENTYVSSQNGNIYSNYNTNNGNTTLDVTGNYDEDGSGGKIRLKRTEDGKGKLSIMIDGQESSVNAEKFNSIISPNKNEVWSTDGGRINVLNLLSNAAIYVAGGFELAESGIDNTTVIDSPDRIIYDETVLGGRFLARKDMTCYTNWKADISKNIAPPSRYGIETDGGVFPFSNQMYKFSNYDNNIFIATCSDGKCTMKHLQ